MSQALIYNLRMKTRLSFLLPAAVVLAFASVLCAKEVKGGPPVIALEAAPWDFELPRGFRVNRQLSKEFQPHQRPALIGDAHLRKHRENYEKHRKNFPEEGVGPWDSSAYSITVDLYRGVGCEDGVAGFLEKWSWDGKAAIKNTALKIHGAAARRVQSSATGAVLASLFLELEGGGCLIFGTTPALQSERAVWEDNIRGLDHIAKTLLPRGAESKKPRMKAAQWSKVPARQMFDGMEGGGGRLKLRSGF